MSTPRRFRMAFEELGPTFVKLGQILSTRVDIFDAEWIEEFEKLQSNVAPIRWQHRRINRILPRQADGGSVPFV